MAASEIPPQMANFQTFYRAAFYFFLAAKTAHFAHCSFVLNFSLSAPKQHILVFRNTPNCSSVQSGMNTLSQRLLLKWFLVRTPHVEYFFQKLSFQTSFSESLLSSFDFCPIEMDSASFSSSPPLLGGAPCAKHYWERMMTADQRTVGSQAGCRVTAVRHSTPWRPVSTGISHGGHVVAG